MPSRIKLAKHRLIIARLVVKLLRGVTAEYMATPLYGSSSGDMMLLMAVYIGQAERRLMTANKLAEYIGMPRSTVIRRLRVLQAAGLLERGEGGLCQLTIERLNEPTLISFIESGVEAVKTAAAELSKLDS